MAKQKQPQSDRVGALGEDWRHVVYAGGVIGAVAGVLLLGAALRADPPGEAAETSHTVGSRPMPISSRPFDLPPEAAPTGPADGMPDDLPIAFPAAAIDDLAERARRDGERLLASGGFTLQLATICDPANAQRWVDAFGASRELFVVPALVDQRACFRVCWGLYATRADAETGRPPAAVTDQAGGRLLVMPVEKLSP